MAGLHDRVERGLAIASTPDQIEQIAPNIYAVRSQSGNGVYLVTVERGSWKCICPDFTAHAFQCKHVISVQLYLKGITPKEVAEVETRRPRPTYRQMWPEYRLAQRAELRLFDEVLHELTDDVEDPTPAGSTGRPRLPFKDVLYCAVERVYHGLPLGVAHGLSDRLLLENRISCSPSRNMASVLFRRPELTPILKGLISRSALALASVEDTFAVDASGFRTRTFGDYLQEKYGAPAKNVWKKLHIIIGVKSHIIPSVVVTEGHVNDSPQLPALVRAVAEAGFTVKEICADRGYLAAENFNVIGAVGGAPFILFKSNSRGIAMKRKATSPLWKQMWHLLQSNPSEFLKHYYMRENVEAVFAGIKKTLGETITSKDPVAQENELLSKVLCWNVKVLIHESFERGIKLPGHEPESPAEADAETAECLAATAGTEQPWKTGPPSEQENN